MNAKLIVKSANKKTGKIPVSMTDRSSCPSTCIWYNKGCYALYGPLNIHWKRVSDKKYGDSWEDFCYKVKSLPSGQLWRHNSAGDLPGEDCKINKEMLQLLITSNQNKKGFTYTHKPITNHNEAENNKKMIHIANQNGFCVNLSAFNIEKADSMYKLNIGPVTVVLPVNSPKKIITPDGNKIIVCPAQLSEFVTCDKCKLCAYTQRKIIIGFLAHGTAKTFVSNKAQ